jgi:hypothetical protein
MKKLACMVLLIFLLIVLIYVTMLLYIKKNTKNVIYMFVIVILTAIVSSYFLIFYSMNNTHYIYNIKDNNKRILQLVLYNEQTPYEVKMKSITEKFYNQCGIDTYYYTYSELYDSITISGNICYIPGKETYIPGILDKTIKVLEYFMASSTQYDYIIRSNVSTIINFKLLMPTIHEYDYGGTMVNLLSWFDYKGGIKDFTYFLTPYVFGTAIIMKDSLVRQIINHKHVIRYDVIDDVSIGYLIKHHLPNIKIRSYLNDVWFSNSIFTGSLKPTFLFYRNKSPNRDDDVVNMEHIIQLISETQLD